MLEVGITGGIGSGKSLVSRLFSMLGVPVYDADSRARWLMINDRVLVDQIKYAFGEGAYGGGNLNRQFLADIVFKDTAKIAVLNNLVHPRVGEDYKRWAAGNRSCPYVLKEAALLFESGAYQQLDKIVAVFAPVALRIERTLKRDKQRNRDQVLAIINNQWEDTLKLEKADFTIYNDDTKMVIPQVLTIDKNLKKA